LLWLLALLILSFLSFFLRVALLSLRFGSQFLLFLNEVLVFLKGMLFQILQILLDVHWLLVELSKHLKEQIISLTEDRLAGSQTRLVNSEFFGNKLNKQAKCGLIQNEPQDDCFMDFDTGKFVTIPFVNNLSNLGKMLGNLRCTLFNDKCILIP